MAVLAIDLGGTRIKLGMFEHGSLVDTVHLANSNTRDDLATVARAALELAAGRRIERVGIAVPGIADADGRRLVIAADKYSWAERVDLAAWSQEAFGAPGLVENDARAALLGVISKDATAANGNAVLLMLGTGIGTAAAVDGTVLRGATGHAGVLGGHVTVDVHGPVCVCGNVGCAEALASTWALARDVAADPVLHEELDATGARGLESLILARKTQAGSAAFGRYVDVWAAVLVNLVHAYDPATVVVAGGALRAGDAVLEPLRRAALPRLWSSLVRPRLIVPPSPEHVVLHGLASLGER